ncbi:hypothetical protein [Azohydromonas lata]|uniref:hypothetical protein n=1 Tax=Azohydromonas lata TaxID=45677 RepID=UPI00082BEFBB|nr:hypothetical protein [Azohydromonas lata]
MPTCSQWVDPEVFMEHAGVTVYRTYVDDDTSQGPSTYSFTLDCLSDDNHFDVRDLALPSRRKLDEHPPFLGESFEHYRLASAQQREEWRNAWTAWQAPGGGQDQAIQVVLRDAIDRGLLVRPSQP